MKNSVISALIVLALLQFIGFSAQAMSCKSVVGDYAQNKPLTLNVIAERIRQGVRHASGGLQGFMANGVLEGYHSAVAVGKSPEEASRLVFKGTQNKMFGAGVKAAQAYYTAVGTGLLPSEVSARIEAGRRHQPRDNNGKHGQIEGYYLAVAFGVAPIDAAKSVQYYGMHSFPNAESYTNLLVAFYAGLAFGVPPKEVGENIEAAYKMRDQVESPLFKGVLSGFYFGAALKNDLD
jgi:hypothetical protein